MVKALGNGYHTYPYPLSYLSFMLLLFALQPNIRKHWVEAPAEGVWEAEDRRRMG